MMRVDTVTTKDNSLLHAVRTALLSAEDAFFCVAFVQEAGLRLIEKELDALHDRGARSRLLVTTTFGTTHAPALNLAEQLGLDVRILNPGSGQTFHPKVYLSTSGAAAHAIIGSANLTRGIASNLEAAVSLRGSLEDEPIVKAWEWVNTLWADERVERWMPQVIELAEEEFEPELFAALHAEVERDPVFMTLGGSPRKNRVVMLTRTAAYVETERSRANVGGPQPIPAWMFNLAWDRLRTHRTLSNAELLDELRVHRSSAVCAVLARLPGVERVAGRTITLRWQPGF